MFGLNDRVVSLVAFLGFTVIVCYSISGNVALRAQDSDLEAFRNLHAELRQQMDDDLQQAVMFLDSKIAQNPDSEDHHVLRHSLASRFLDQQDYRQAAAQFRKLLDFYLKHAENGKNLFGAWMTIQSLQQVADRSRNDLGLRLAIDDALQAFRTLSTDANHQWLMPLSQLIVLKSQLMAQAGEADAAAELIENQIRRLRDINGSGDASEASMMAYVRMLRELAGDRRGNDSWRDQSIARLDEAVVAAIDKFPESVALQSDYADIQLRMITQWKQDDPDATQERIDKVSQMLSRYALKNRSVQSTLRRIDVYRRRMAAAKPVASLVGQPAPQWDVDAWVNVIEMDPEKLKGKVVLLDFWAMWCGPCIATFEHLREWREEFADRGFEIVGVTQYYNFKWDEETKRASHATDAVSPEEERQTLAAFLRHHGLEHPILVTPEGSKMQGEFAVRGIPHVVLIDREGIVQLVKTGAGQATADEIHTKIKQLLATND